MNHGLRCRLKLSVGATNIFIQEIDKTLTAQGLASDCFQCFWAESFDVVGYEVILQFVGTSPREGAEVALVRGFVFVIHVSFEFLVPPEGFAADSTGMAWLVSAGRGTISPLLSSDIGFEMSSSSLGLGLWVRRWCVSIHSRMILGGVCLIG